LPKVLDPKRRTARAIGCRRAAADPFEVGCAPWRTRVGVKTLRGRIDRHSGGGKAGAAMGGRRRGRVTDRLDRGPVVVNVPEGSPGPLARDSPQQRPSRRRQSTPTAAGVAGVRDMLNWLRRSGWRLRLVPCCPAAAPLYCGSVEAYRSRINKSKNSSTRLRRDH